MNLVQTCMVPMVAQRCSFGRLARITSGSQSQDKVGFFVLVVIVDIERQVEVNFLVGKCKRSPKDQCGLAFEYVGAPK